MQSLLFDYRLMRAYGNGRVQSVLKALYMKAGRKVFISASRWGWWRKGGV